MMDQPLEQPLVFGPFVLERTNARLLRDGRDIPLSPKGFDVLAHLAGHPDQLVSKQQLLATVWPDVIVSDASVKVCIREIRKALDDNPDTPRFIQTVHRRGYRFVAPVNTPPTASSAAAPQANGGAVAHAPPRSAMPAVPTAPISRQPTPLTPFVGRDRELGVLHDCFARASSGSRQVAFITGPPGTGKTALVDAFLHRLSADSTGSQTHAIAVGHCIEQFGGGEPYLPFWEALAHLGKQRELPPALQLIDPSRQDLDATGAADREVPTEPRQPSGRRLRELAAGIEALALEAPLVLVLEDLHWADYSTLDLVCALARRRGPARLLIVITCRSGEDPGRERPLRDIAHDLRGVCHELALGPLDACAVSRYLAARFPDQVVPDLLPRILHRKTGGQPLFLASLVDELADRRELQAAGDSALLSSSGRGAVPRSIRAFIDHQLERLSVDEQRVLEAAAVAGTDFSAATAAAALDDDVVAVERTCDGLARRHRFLESVGVADWPDGTLSNRYRFTHELYHNAVLSRIPAARRVQMHRAVGNRLEAAWASRPGGDAAEIALHFERGRDFPRAVRYLRQCADHAARQYAHREAIDYLRRSLALLDRLPAADRAPVELPLLKSLVVQLQVTLGFSAPEVRAIQARAYELCAGAASSDPAATFPVLWGIWLFHKVRSELRRARALADKLHAMAEQSADSSLLLQAYQAISVTALCLGDPRRCQEQIDRAARIYDPGRHAGNAHVYGQDPCVATAAFGAVALWLTGNEGAAVATSERAIHLARDLAQPSSLALALHFAAMLHQLRGDAPAVLGLTDEELRLAHEHGFSFWMAGGAILRGWALSASGDAGEGIAQMRAGIDAWLATGSRTYHTYYLGLLADGLHRDGRHRQAIATIDEALAAAAQMPEGLYESELHRLRARCLLLAAGAPEDQGHREAAESLARAIDVARSQGAAAFEQRANQASSTLAPASPAMTRA